MHLKKTEDIRNKKTEEKPEKTKKFFSRAEKEKQSGKYLFIYVYLFRHNKNLLFFFTTNKSDICIPEIPICRYY